jgi:hypothetical protein
VRGDGTGGSPQGNGANGITNSNPSQGAQGGRGVAGGGRGGNSRADQSNPYGEDGTAGFGSPAQFVVGGTGAGQGNVGSQQSGNFTIIAATPSGGGGGHSVKGTDGTANVHANNTLTGTPRGAGGAAYPTGPGSEAMRTPSAGSGGGAAGFAYETSFPTFYPCSGGAGGAGGGFVDLTSSGDIRIYGIVDASGSRGGSGVNSGFSASGGGGGGSGGGVRLLTPNEIDVTGGTITAGSGAGGTGAGLGGAPNNPGGAGGLGRLAMEDQDSLVAGLATATVAPAEGAAGFYRGTFDASRFVGGGLRPEVVTELILVGPTSPAYVAPVASDFPATPFGAGVGPGAGIPAASSRGPNATGILIEARGYLIDPNGDPDLGSATAYHTVGYFADSGLENAPTWVPNAFPGDIGPRPADNAGDGIANLDGRAFLQLRVTFFLPTGLAPSEPGPFLNRWLIHFTYDQ